MNLHTVLLGPLTELPTTTGTPRKLILELLQQKMSKGMPILSNEVSKPLVAKRQNTT
jgi:hypothetical protein